MAPAAQVLPPGDAGPYFLSSSTPGMYTKQQPPVSVFIGTLHGNSSAVFAPTPKDLLDAHVHYAVDLVAHPAGTMACPSPDREYEFIDVNPNLPGWLPAHDPVFMGLAPHGAVYGYNMALDPNLSKIWPPIPLVNAYIEKNGVGVDPADRTFSIIKLSVAGRTVVLPRGPFAIETTPLRHWVFVTLFVIVLFLDVAHAIVLVFYWRLSVGSKSAAAGICLPIALSLSHEALLHKDGAEECE